MAAVPTLGQVHEMVMQAMRDLAPAMYRELLANGELERTVQERVESFDQIFSELSSAATRKAQQLPLEEGMRGLEEADRSAVEQALAVALEFPAHDSVTDK